MLLATRAGELDRVGRSEVGSREENLRSWWKVKWANAQHSPLSVEFDLWEGEKGSYR